MHLISNVLSQFYLTVLNYLLIALVQQWNERKRKLFKPSHLRKAWKRLKEENWLIDKSTTNS